MSLDQERIRTLRAARFVLTLLSLYLLMPLVALVLGAVAGLAYWLWAR